MQRAIEKIKSSVKEVAIISDVALDPYTTHGQDGILGKNGEILNDETVVHRKYHILYFESSTCSPQGNLRFL